NPPGPLNNRPGNSGNTARGDTAEVETAGANAQAKKDHEQVDLPPASASDVVQVVETGSASAGNGPEAHVAIHDAKVTICHATNSATNPYVRITVGADAANADTGNDSGHGDHSLHLGPIAVSVEAAKAMKAAHEGWGDIIPAHDNFPGRNLTATGQLIFNNGCAAPTITPQVPATFTVNKVYVGT